MGRRRGWLAFSYLTSIAFPRVTVHDHGCGPVNRIRFHISLAIRSRGTLWSTMVGAVKAVPHDACLEAGTPQAAFDAANHGGQQAMPTIGHARLPGTAGVLAMIVRCLHA